MQTFWEDSVQIDASADDVWAYVAGSNRHPEWDGFTIELIAGNDGTLVRQGVDPHVPRVTDVVGRVLAPTRNRLPQAAWHKNLDQLKHVIEGAGDGKVVEAAPVLDPAAVKTSS